MMKRDLQVLLSVLAAVWVSACVTTPSSSIQWSDAVNDERLIVVTIRNERPTLVPRAGSTVRSYSAPSRYALAPATVAHSRSLAADYNLREVTGWPIGLLGVHCLVYELAADTDREALLGRLRRDRRVESAQPLQRFETSTHGTADPYRSLQHNLDVMNVDRAHRWSRGEGVRIGIIDTSVDVAHPELAGRIAANRDFVDTRRAKRRAEAHGTAVAGLIGARDRNDIGIVGVAPAARLYALRACWSEPGTAEARCNTLTLAKALVAAIDARVHVVNLSLGGPHDPLLTRIVHKGLERGIVFVGAAPEHLDHAFPTAIPGVIGVDALHSARTADALLFAPGQDVLTLSPQESYAFLSGSSLAAASVSGGIALLLARAPELTAERIQTLLISSARKREVQTDAPIVDFCAAMTTLIRSGTCE